MKQLICAALTLLVWSGTAHAEELGEPETSPTFGCYVDDSTLCMTVDEYRTAGLVGTFVGLGVGHLMTGETGRSAGLLVTEGLFAAAIGVGILMFVDVIPLGGDAMGADIVGGVMYISGSVGLVISRIWEKVDVWKRPRFVRSRAGRGHA